MNDYELFMSIGEPFAAGLFELEGEAPIVRHANALKRFFENTELPPYLGGRIYPSGECSFRNDDLAVVPHYSNTFAIKHTQLKEKSVRGYELMCAEDDLVVKFHDSPHTVAGMGWMHSFPNYSRIIREGLDGYSQRIYALPDGDFKKGMTILLQGIKIYHSRCLGYIKEQNAPTELISALEKVPYKPAESIYEAIISLNFIFYLDGCDNIGPLDKILLPYHRGEDMTEIFDEFFRNVDINDGWSGTLGPSCNELTRACIAAIRNKRRPNLQLLVTENMPDWVWEECVASLSTSCGQPAFYNCELYMSELKKLMPYVSLEDLSRISFGGCTETMFEGLSAVGSDDAGLNIALIFSDYMRSELTARESFESFYKGLVENIRKVFCEVIDRLNLYRKTRAQFRPDVMRTLLVDDCIDTQTEFNAGGARYVYSVINIAGVINVIDSLNVLRELVYEKKLYTPEEFITLMDARDREFLRNAKSCPSYGNDNEYADGIGKLLIDDIAKIFESGECYPRGRFYPVANQFTTYVNAGKNIPATPDGRSFGEPLCDSMGAIHQNDSKGATAMLNSVSRLTLSKIIGTPTTNIRISKKQLSRSLKPLVKAFFENGGMQLQVSCLSREEMLDAIDHPERHSSLVVRIGGYSEYFTRLSRELQQTVLERTEY